MQKSKIKVKNGGAACCSAKQRFAAQHELPFFFASRTQAKISTARQVK
jgi:hypothetical protein